MKMIRHLFIYILILAAGVLGLQVQIDQGKRDFLQEQRRPFVPPRADLVKVFALGYHNVLADAYWLGAIQYFAEASQKKGEPPRDLYPMVNFLTDLDPHYQIAYYFAAVGLTLLYGNSTEVINILEKGKKYNPDYAPIAAHLGYYYYFETNHPELAAENYELAYRLTKNRLFGMLAARIRYEAGSPERALEFLEELYQEATEERTKELYAQRIALLQTKLLERRLSELVSEYQLLKGEKPRSLLDLKKAGLLKEQIEHPLPGHQFVYDQQRGEVRSEPPVYFGVFNRYQPRPDQPQPGITP